MERIQTFTKVNPYEYTYANSVCLLKMIVEVSLRIRINKRFRLANLLRQILYIPA
jgi:hypothetical protein